MKLATWNVNSIRARLEVVLRWLREESPDVLCMQEIKVQEDLFPREPFEKAGYHLVINGQKTWNGVAIASKIEPTSVRLGLPGGFLDEQKRLLAVDVGGVTVVNVYVPNGGDVNLERFTEKLEYLDRLRTYSGELAGNGPLVVMGDFNVAPGPDDVHDPEALEGTVCYHPEERLRIGEMLSDGLIDIFRKFNPEGKAYSWWDYRAGGFRRNLGMRLDLVLVNAEAAAMAVGCEIQREPRSWEKPSDHTPVVVDLEGLPGE